MCIITIFKILPPVTCSDLQPQELRNMVCFEYNFKRLSLAFMMVYPNQILWERILALWALISNYAERENKSKETEECMSSKRKGSERPKKG